MLKLAGLLFGLITCMGIAPPVVQETCEHQPTVYVWTARYELHRLVYNAGSIQDQDIANYNPTNDTVNSDTWDGNGITGVQRDPDVHYGSYNSHTDGFNSTQGTTDDQTTVGQYIIRERPNATLMSKGWFGTDELGNIAFTVPIRKTRWMKSISWPGSNHNGIGSIDNELAVETRWIDICDTPFEDGTGQVRPMLKTILIVRNIGAPNPKIETAEINYTHEMTRVVTNTIQGTVNFIPGPQGGPGGSVQMSSSQTYNITNEYIFAWASPTCEAAGTALSPAEIELRNRLSIGLEADKAVLSWRMEAGNDANAIRRLDITPLHTSKPLIIETWTSDPND